MRLPPLPPLTPTVEYTMDEIQALILAYGAAVREECARVADSAKVIPDFGDDKAAAETMTALLDLYFGVVAAAIRKD